MYSSVITSGVLSEKDMISCLLEEHKLEVINNIKFLSELLNVKLHLFNKIDFSEECNFGFVHGDFHLGNVML
ncbi:hypothetical protein, partial [Shewanella sp. BJSY2023SW001]|uniref:hypothetical protein n=1 Tax=Shewanella sp. BJSY2023SW001 TaxID=3392039 RepID=UPI0039B50DD8